MTTFALEDDRVRIPSWVKDLKSFRRWVHSESFPEHGRICFLRGEVWVDLSMEQVFTHNQVKGEFNISLGGWIKTNDLGRFFPDGAQLTNALAELSTIADGVFVSEESMDEGLVRFVEGKREGYLELQGTPDMVLEVVSPSSVEKDTEILPELYWKAGIPEYWLVDARKEPLQFDIFKRAEQGYVPTRKVGGWMKSTVFAASFRLTREKDKRGNPVFALAIK
jgi:Uma2 family endonuclease